MMMTLPFDCGSMDRCLRWGRPSIRAGRRRLAGWAAACLVPTSGRLSVLRPRLLRRSASFRLLVVFVFVFVVVVRRAGADGS